MKGKQHTLRVLAACATFFFSLPGFAEDSNPYLASISIERTQSGQQMTEGYAQLTMHVSDPGRAASALSAIDGVEVVASGEHTVRIVFIEKPTVSGQPDEEFRHSTFVIDFEEASVLSLSKDLHAALEQQPSTDQLVDYVYEHISDKTYARAFDFASQVATSGRGDCTEHAVLLAALARASGYHARVVFGTLILDTASDSYAFGHAWTEIHDGVDWQIRDATRPEDDQAMQHVRYLPSGLLANEGPGYSLAMFQAIDAMPKNITDFGKVDR